MLRCGCTAAGLVQYPANLLMSVETVGGGGDAVAKCCNVTAGQ